jgi:hypothetical protein
LESSYFVFSGSPLLIDRFHICTWEFSNNTALVEFGCEFNANSIANHECLNLGIYIPWLELKHEPKDLYNSLKTSDNSKFIFNDAVQSTDSLDNGANSSGVIHHFSGKSALAILPVNFEIDTKLSKVLNLNVDLSLLKKKDLKNETNVYVRFYLEPDIFSISTRKNRIGSSKIIYDIKLNELRNLPKDLLSKTLCKVETCFNFNIIPNGYELTFFDTNSLQSVRTLEYDSFKKYLPDTRVKDQELLVVFNKHKNKFNFFVSFSSERVGTGQFALAILINIVCGILLTFPTYRTDSQENKISISQALPYEFWLAIIIGICVAIYFVSPYLKTLYYRIRKNNF